MGGFHSAPISSARHQVTPPSPSGLLAGLAWSQVRPPNYSPDRLPETSFTCEDKVSGSYYADVEASCQLFHVCVQVSELEVSILDRGRCPQKKTGKCGNFEKTGGGVYPNPTSFVI